MTEKLKNIEGELSEVWTMIRGRRQNKVLRKKLAAKHGAKKKASGKTRY